MSYSRQPKGLSISWRVAPGLVLVGLPHKAFRAAVKSRGRTGAAMRSRFLRATCSQQQQAMLDWGLGRSTEALS
jgi:hypothetical protein